jgi:hypothetical protein
MSTWAIAVLIISDCEPGILSMRPDQLGEIDVRRSVQRGSLTHPRRFAQLVEHFSPQPGVTLQPLEHVIQAGVVDRVLPPPCRPRVDGLDRRLQTLEER